MKTKKVPKCPKCKNAMQFDSVFDWSVKKQAIYICQACEVKRAVTIN